MRPDTLQITGYNISSNDEKSNNRHIFPSNLEWSIVLEAILLVLSMLLYNFLVVNNGFMVQFYEMSKKKWKKVKKHPFFHCQNFFYRFFFDKLQVFGP